MDRTGQAPEVTTPTIGRIVGVDGCRSGWLCVSIPSAGDAPAVSTAPNFAHLLELFSSAVCIAIDIPIGLPDQGPRACDVEARALIKPRSSSVFPVPIRGVLRARSYAEAAEEHRALDNGRSLSKQAFAILPQIVEVDAALRGDPELRAIVYEVHPELCFRVWAGKPMLYPKRTKKGESDRTRLIEAVWPGALARCAGALAKVGGWQDDDLIDAFAALWTARRIVAGTALSVPSIPEMDSSGLPMRMLA